MKYDVIVVGAGTAGLVCGSLLAKEGRKVAIVESHRYLGGRAMERRFRGHQIGMGSHLVEDPGDSLTRALDYVGVALEPVLGPHGLEAHPGVLRRRCQTGPQALH